MSGLVKAIRRLVCHPAFWTLVVLAGTLPTFISHLFLAGDASRFNGDVAQHIAPYVIQYETGMARDDVISSYYRAFHPVGYRALYTEISTIADPRSFSKILPYVLLILFIAACGWGAYALSGNAGVLVVLVVSLSSEVFLTRMIGGCPRAFAFPIVALGLSAMIRDKPKVLALSVVLGAAFYPPVAVGLASMLALLLLPPKKWACREKAVPFGVRLGLLSLTAGLAILLVVPPQIAGRKYGPVVAQDISNERLKPVDRFDFAQPLPVYFITAFHKVIAGKGHSYLAKPHRWIMGKNAAGQRQRLKIIAGVIAEICCLGWGIAAWRSHKARRLALAAGSIWGVYLVSIRYSPLLFLPERQIAYFLPAIALLVFIVGGAEVLSLVLSLRSRGQKRQVMPWMSGVFCGIILLFTLAPLRLESGFKIRIAAADEEWLRYLTNASASALIAGNLHQMDLVAYVTGHRVLANWETSLPYHAAYTREINRRKEVLHRAMAMPNSAAWQELKDSFGVTHLVIPSTQLSTMVSGSLQLEGDSFAGMTVQFFGAVAVVTLSP